RQLRKATADWPAVSHCPLPHRQLRNRGNTSSRVTSRHFKLSNWSLLNTDGPEWLFSMHHESLLTVPCSHFEVQKLLKVQS
ncbi:hypothetical protein, partial [Methylomonas lenta]|uniref:hypothetical protein n=1 Tax=Methylomonas lenta TaxID=980561 RepID=UPI001E5035A2